MTDKEMPPNNNEPSASSASIAAPSVAPPLPENSMPPSPQPKAERRLWPAGLAIFSAILALITAWGGYQLWIELNQARSGYLRSVETNRTQFTQLQNDVDSKVRTQLEAATGQIKADIANAQQQVRGEAEQKVSSMQQSIAEVEGGFAELRNQLIERIETVEQAQSGQQAMIQQAQLELRQAIADHQLNWAMSEIGYLIAIANDKLQFEQNTEAALTALSQALQRLRELNEPTLSNLRDAVQQDITTLAESPRATAREAIVKLSELTKQTDHLAVSRKIVLPAPASAQSQTVAATNSSLQNTWEKTWGWLKEAANSAWVEVRNLVVIRHNEQAVPPLLPPDQAFFLEQNLRLQLETARLAILRQDDDVYRNLLEEAKAWVTRYFDPQAAPVQQFLADIDNLLEQDLTPPTPELKSLPILGQMQQLTNLSGAIAPAEMPADNNSSTTATDNTENQAP